MSSETGHKPSAPSSGGPSRYQGRPSGRPGGPPSGPGGRRRLPIKRRVCRVCHDRTGPVDWKAVNMLRNFVTDRGKILSARSTGTCASCQRELTRAIKRARNMALLPTSPV